VVTKISEIRESSIVSFPADKFAKNRIGKAKSKSGSGAISASFSFSDDTEEARNLFETKQTYVLQLDLPTGEEQDEQAEAQPETQTQDFQTLSQNFEAMRLEYEKAKADVAKLEAENKILLQGQASLRASVAKHIEDLAQAQRECEQFQAKATELEPRAIIGDATMIDLRRETETAYSLTLKSGVADKFILKQIQEADFDTLKALHNQYTKLFEAKHELSCKDCGSHNVSAQSSLGGNLQKFEGAKQTSPKGKLSDNAFKNR
jgi:hypothetical protein